jgi:hypothetical protein
MAAQGLKSRVRVTQFHCPLGDAPGGIPIVEDIHQREVGDHQDVVCVEIMAKLPEGDEYTVD